MGILKKILGLSTNKIISCDHDWEIVNCYSWTDVAKEVCKREGINYTPVDSAYQARSFGAYEVLRIGSHIILASWDTDTNTKVCLKCGECYHGFNVAVLWLQNEYGKEEEQSIIGKQRAKKAKKLWEENCLFNA